MISSTFAALWNEPRAPDAPARVWRDWVMVVVFVSLMIAEVSVQPELVWPAPTLGLGVALVLGMLWRRTQPLFAVCAAFGGTAVLELLGIMRGVDWNGLNTYACIVVLPYALARWASGRESVIGALVIAGSLAVTMWADALGWREIAGASLFLLFPAALGASFRYLESGRRREHERVRLRERTELARELHDSVAHHVSAIAIQAQAGQALAATRPEAAAEVLAVIEDAATRSLDEMRSMVGALRDGEAAERVPRHGLDDIERLAHAQATTLKIRIQREGDLEGLEPAVETTLYRIAREAITNAARHARGAERVDVHIAAEAGRVSMTIQDDGVGTSSTAAGGFGLRGMKERVELLGGTLRAAPGGDCGWRVEAILPRGST